MEPAAASITRIYIYTYIYIYIYVYTHIYIYIHIEWHQLSEERAGGDYTLNPTPYTLHPTPYTLHLGWHQLSEERAGGASRGVDQAEGGGERGGSALVVVVVHHGRDLIAASIYHKHSVGPSIRPMLFYND